MITYVLEYIRKDFKLQSCLKEIARKVVMDTYLFQRMFIDWVGVDTKKFLQYISIEYAKKVLDVTPVSLSDTAKTDFRGRAVGTAISEIPVDI